MAWIDDRVWCHPKLTDISDKAFRVNIHGLAYSAGFGCRGVLTVGQQKQIGSNAKVKRELLVAGLWDALEAGAVAISGWDEHNGKRDDRRVKERDRLRAKRKLERDAERNSTQLVRATERATDADARCVEGSEGSEGIEGSAVYSAPIEIEEPGTIIDLALKRGRDAA